MEIGKLTVQYRVKTGKGISRVTRRNGDVPGVCYGHGMEAPVPVSLNIKEMKAAFDPAKRRNTVLNVTIEGADKPMSFEALLWNYQIHPIRQEVTHVDIKAIDPEQPVEAVVPIASTGKHKGAIDGGLLSWSMHEVKVMARPADIPVNLTLDISPMGLGDAMHVSDLPLPEGVTYADSPKLGIVTCLAPKGLKSEKKKQASEGDAPAEEEKK